MFIRTTTLLTTLTLLMSCADQAEDAPVVMQDIKISFSAQFGDEPFSCDGSFAGVGRGDQTYTPTDARLYVHDVTLVRADGTSTPLTLKEDAVFQSQGVALLDFESGADNCANGTLLTNTEILGTAPEGEYTGVRFTIGVPASLNHGNQATAASPLNLTGLWWSWLDGYKFMKVDGRTEGMPIGALFHLGSTQCVDENTDTVCENENTPTIALDWTPSQTIIFDLKKLFEDAHLDMDEGGDLGCTSSPQDPDCAPIFRNLGMPLDAIETPQRVFRTEPS